MRPDMHIEGILSTNLSSSGVDVALRAPPDFVVV